MFYTHHFAHRETLTRARDWLSQVGYATIDTDANAAEGGSHRLVLDIEPQSQAAAAFLISAVERTDPDGWPSFWDSAHRPHAAFPAADVPAPPRTAAIGWHPVD